MKVEAQGKKMKPSTVKELKAEIIRLEECFKAYETAEHKVLRVEFYPIDGHLFPKVIITAPGMNEAQIAEHAYKVYFLYAETLKACMGLDRDKDAIREEAAEEEE